MSATAPRILWAFVDVILDHPWNRAFRPRATASFEHTAASVLHGPTKGQKSRQFTGTFATPRRQSAIETSLRVYLEIQSAINRRQRGKGSNHHIKILELGVALYMQARRSKFQ